MRRAYFLWNIPNCEGGDPLRIAAEAVQAGLRDVFVKVADGPYRFGVYNKVDAVPPVVTALQSVGIRVWGWQYIYGNNPAGEAQAATARIQELGLDAFIVDAEQEFKKPGWDRKAEAYLQALKAQNPDVTVAFSSYRFPSLHREFPWAVFFRYCDINMPQVYWEQAVNSGAQLARCLDEFRAMTALPLYPVGAAYKWNGWRPTLAQVQEFEAVAQANRLPLVSYWSWEHTRRDLPELWPKGAVPPKDPDTRLAELERSIAALRDPISELKGAVAKLETIVSNLK